ncbi:UPF0669 protein C6orf120 homolog [Schistocerca nitens]|uniref:UPF0669 protein C6orf120 homolog n=1 Tax=Schistocerca nitens TaxID=7011 RepID=UPI0021180F25|nr:UPF0669 protein C6orf120 homolog [Schistocerca nitens]
MRKDILWASGSEVVYRCFFSASNMLCKIALMLLIFTGKCAAEHLLHMSVEEVTAHNYTYYSLSYEGYIRLYLYSLNGDADLYVSQYVSKPTYDPGLNCAQSTTCGVDVVDIPRSFRRPVGIGVYGHPSHQRTEYRLEAYYIDDEHDSGDVDIRSSGTVETGSTGVPKKKKASDDTTDESVIWSFVFYIFEVAFDIMFI